MCKMTCLKIFTFECTVLVFFILQSKAQKTEQLWCSIKDSGLPGPSLPLMPLSYSAQIQVNYESHHYATEIIKKVDISGNRSSFEIWAGDRHVKYISLKKQSTYLILNYQPSGITCKTLNSRPEYQENDAGPHKILQIVQEKILPKTGNFKSKGADVVKGIYVLKWEICEYVPEFDTAVKVVLSFSDVSWIPSHPVTSKQIKNDLVMIEVELQGKNMEDIRLTADISQYNPNPLDDKDFQPPEGVHCPNFQTNVKPPKLPNYFSYQSETVAYVTAAGVAPLVYYTKVYYDYKVGISRMDVQIPSNETKVVPDVKSLIHDFNRGVQYAINPLSGTCRVSAFTSVFDATLKKKQATTVMPDPSEFFLLNSKPLSYNGKFETRGLITNMFSGLSKKDDVTTTYFWYFTSDRIRIYENQQVEKNVLVKMVSRSETAEGKKGEFEINFYNFKDEEPNIFAYDITPCYNSSQYKFFTFTFPATNKDVLIESKILVKYKMHQAIKEAAGVSQHRVYIQTIMFRKQYLFVLFKLLDLPSVEVDPKKPVAKENSLNEAVESLKKSVADNKFVVTFRTSDNEDVVLRPEPNGLNEYSGASRGKSSKDVGYAEGGVIGLAVGMLLLGFLLGGVMVNLAVSKKYGVSLLQKSFPGSGARQLENLGESSM